MSFQGLYTTHRWFHKPHTSVGRIQGCDPLQGEVQSALHVLQLQFQSLWDFSWRRAQLQFPFLTHFPPMPIKIYTVDLSFFHVSYWPSQLMWNQGPTTLSLSYLEASKLWSIAQKLYIHSHAPKYGGSLIFVQDCPPIQSFTLPNPTPSVSILKPHLHSPSVNKQAHCSLKNSFPNSARGKSSLVFGSDRNEDCLSKTPVLQKGRENLKPHSGIRSHLCSFP